MPDPKTEEQVNRWKAAWLLSKAQQQPSHVIEALGELLVDAERQLTKTSSHMDVWSNLVILMQTEDNHWDIATFPAITRAQLKEMMERTGKKTIFSLRDLPKVGREPVTISTALIDNADLEDGGVYLIAKRKPPSLAWLGDANLVEIQQKNLKVMLLAVQQHAALHLTRHGYKGVKRVPGSLLDKIKLPMRPDALVVAASHAVIIQFCCVITVASVLQMAVTLAQLRQLPPGDPPAVPELQGRSLSGALYGIAYTSNQEKICELQHMSEQFGLQIWLWKPKWKGWDLLAGRPGDPGPDQPNWLNQLGHFGMGVIESIQGRNTESQESSDTHPLASGSVDGRGFETSSGGNGFSIGTGSHGNLEAVERSSTTVLDGYCEAQTKANALRHNTEVTALDVGTSTYSHAALDASSGSHTASGAVHYTATVQQRTWGSMSYNRVLGRQTSMCRSWPLVTGLPVKCLLPRLRARTAAGSGIMTSQRFCTNIM